MKSSNYLIAAVLLLASLFVGSFSQAQFPVKSQSIETIHANNSYLFDADARGVSLLANMADSIIPLSNRDVLLRLEVLFQGVPSKEAALGQVIQEMQPLFRDGQIVSLQDGQQAMNEASIILSVVAPHLNATRHRDLVDSVQQWFDGKPNERAVLRIKPRASFSKHALALVSFEGERAQALIVYIPERN